MSLKLQFKAILPIWTRKPVTYKSSYPAPGRYTDLDFRAALHSLRLHQGPGPQQLDSSTVNE